MFGRLLRAEGLSRAARTVEYFGFFDFALGFLLLVEPRLTVTLLHVPPLTTQGENYLRLVGLLVSGLGVLYIVSGRLNSQGFVFASMLDRPLVPAVMAVLWCEAILPWQLALAFAVSDFGGFLLTFFAWRADERLGPDIKPPLIARALAVVFGFVSGVARNARTFHPDGRVIRAMARSWRVEDEILAKAGELLAGPVLLRAGMGLMKKSAPRWLAEIIPDAPSIACRFFEPVAGNEDGLWRRAGWDLDLLCTAGGDRLWKLVLNLSTGGWMYGLVRFDYFRNVYFSQTPYQISGTPAEFWIRLVPSTGPVSISPKDDAGREKQLTIAISEHAVLRMEARHARERNAPWIPFAELRLEEEIHIDQEALHFDPVGGRGFVPTGFLTSLRKTVYPSSRMHRPSSVQERVWREQEGIERRLKMYLKGRLTSHSDVATAGEGQAGTKQPRRSSKIFWLSALVLTVLLGTCLAVRFTRDQPVQHVSDVQHFLYGSTGGEKRDGIPYWIWVALPELLPDKTPGRGYSSFGMIYDKGKDPRYDLPVGTMMRNYRGIDLVYLNCAACHTGSVRDAPGNDPTIVPGMPANTFDLGAWGHFLTSVPLDQKFTGQRLLDQIKKMQNDPHRLVSKPDFINRLLIRYYVPDAIRDQLIILKQRLSFIDELSWGPGRVDTFNAPKALLNFPMQHADPKELVGNADFPSVWNQGPRKGMQLHWDGNNTSVDERNLSAAFGTGAYPPNLDVDLVLRTAKWLETAKPPKYPYHVDDQLAAAGAVIYEKYCLGCHGTSEAPFRHTPPLESERVGTVAPIENIGTDRARLDSYTWELAVNQSTLYAGYELDWGFDQAYPQRFSHFRKTNGYANVPLDGIWLRAPYLHNGSVPNLRQLLEPSSNRSRIFYRGSDVYDPENVGFVYDVPEEGGSKFFAYDTTKTGNHNFGHEGPAYGTNLPGEQKRALLEYLKNF
jgi:mono/diheme cytochrome c family protein